MLTLLTDLGVANSFHIPFGIEPDVFHPWGSAHRPYDETTYLAIVDRQQGRLLRLILDHWHRFLASGTAARLIVLGCGISDCLGR